MQPLRHRVLRARSRALTAAVAALAVVAGVITASPAEALSSPAAAPSAATVTAPASVVKTADLGGFDPGNIISDAVFFNSKTMTEAEIQRFLEQRVPSCRSGYTCLKDWYDTSRDVAADAMCGAYDGGWRERASAIIYRVAQACGINPQVIIATLQKEQGLITHVWPSDWRYRIAMGQGCPDTAACDTRYYGFFNQIYGAARQFKRYANPPGTSQFFTWYAPGRTWNVLYNPNYSCGRGPVAIRNQATANLYYYTPYQPNAAALRAGYGLGDGCSAYGNRNFYNYFTDWFGSTQVSRTNAVPVGRVDAVFPVPGGVRVAGWAADPDSTDPIAVHVYAPSFRTVTASSPRSDVARAFPSLGANRGFATTVKTKGTTPVSACVYAIDTSPSIHSRLTCRTVTPLAGAPIGRLDGVTATDGVLTVDGWAFDPDVADAVTISVNVDGKSAASAVASSTRSDVAKIYPGWGSQRGYRVTTPATPGVHEVCASAIDTSTRSPRSLGCRSVSVPVTNEKGRAPVGAVDTLALSGTRATVGGWVIDPDTLAPADVSVYVDGVLAVERSDAASVRSDIARKYPGYGAAHGYTIAVTLPNAAAEVCVVAHNTAGEDRPLGCRSTSGAIEPRAATGRLDVLDRVPGALRVSGWAADPDTGAPVAVDVEVAGTRTTTVAEVARGDVAVAYPRLGARRGFVATVPVGLGATPEVCVYAHEAGSDARSLLGCTTATPESAAPIGRVDAVTPAAGEVLVSGWALDPETDSPIAVAITVDGVLSASAVANLERTGVAAAYPLWGPKHGFRTRFEVAPGEHTVCAVAVNVGAGSDTALRCETVTVG